LIVLDASWRQANRLRKRFAARSIRFAQLPVGGNSIYGLRNEPHDRGVCTLEAIARALQALEGGSIEADMLTALRVFRDRRLWLRGHIERGQVEGGLPDGVDRHRIEL
jgi:DTW domain-containing protein YfiP